MTRSDSFSRCGSQQAPPVSWVPEETHRTLEGEVYGAPTCTSPAPSLGAVRAPRFLRSSLPYAERRRQRATARWSRVCGGSLRGWGRLMPAAHGRPGAALADALAARPEEIGGSIAGNDGAGCRTSRCTATGRPRDSIPGYRNGNTRSVRRCCFPVTTPIGRRRTRGARGGDGGKAHDHTAVATER